MRRSLLLLFFFLICRVAVFAHWQLPVTNYTRHEYRASAQNWMAAQHPNGWIYIANDKGLLEFDGVNWQTYTMHHAKVRAVKIGRDGRIYAGGISHFGYFSPDSLGSLRFHELGAPFPHGMNIGTVRNILDDGKKIIFQSDRYLFYLKGKTVESIDFKKQISCSALFGNRPHIISENGLYEVNGRRFRCLASSESMPDAKFVAMAQYGSLLLMVTDVAGIYCYDGKNVRPYLTPSEMPFLRNLVYRTDLQGDRLALGTELDGVGVVDLKKRSLLHLSTDDGLQNKNVHDVMFDRDSNLWVSLNYGMDYVRLASDVFSLSEGSRIIGSGYASCNFGGYLYLGTNQGVYRMDSSDRGAAGGGIAFLEESQGQLWKFLPFDGRLFCASHKGLFTIGSDGKMERIGKINGVREITPMPGRGDVLVAGTYGIDRGLYLLKKTDGVWRVEGKIANCSVSCKNLYAESSTFIWISNKGEGVFRLLLSDNLKEVRQQKKYNRFPMNRDICFSRIGSDLVVASHYGLWKFNERGDSLERFENLERLLDGDTSFSFITEDPDKNLWYASGGVMKMKHYDRAGGVYDGKALCYLNDALIESFENVSFSERGTVAGTEDGFSEIVPGHSISVKDRRSISIRKIYTTGVRDSLIYGRSYDGVGSVPDIGYNDNSLRISYSVTGYSSSRPLVFSYKLEKNGKEEKWSGPYAGFSKEFTGLPEGDYVFSVRLADKQDSETSVAFRILPPWYRSWWSYLGLTAAAVCLILFFRRRMARKMERQNYLQEIEFQKQEEELKKENELKDLQISKLEEENLQSELKYKSEELMRTTLNIVRKNEMLTELNKGVDSISRALKENDLVALRRRLVRLQGQIATNIEHDDDLQKFQTSFDSVHHDFFKRLEEEHPDLSHKEKLLCAYIQMNLLTKEIAPLLNISVRGVEIGRYRLRKKLKLEERASLTEHLRQLTR